MSVRASVLPRTEAAQLNRGVDLVTTGADRGPDFRIERPGRRTPCCADLWWCRLSEAVDPVWQAKKGSNAEAQRSQGSQRSKDFFALRAASRRATARSAQIPSLRSLRSLRRCVEFLLSCLQSPPHANLRQDQMRSPQRNTSTAAIAPLTVGCRLASRKAATLRRAKLLLDAVDVAENPKLGDPLAV